MTEPLPKADPAMFSDCGAEPCPQPITSDPANADAVQDLSVRMRDNPAEWAFVRLSKLIQEFEANLNKDEEIGASVVGLPGDGTMQILDVGYWGPDLIMFFGRNADGKPVRLIQHYAQMNVVLSAIKKPENQAEPNRIGFRLDELVKNTNPSARIG
ncbi:MULTISPECIES: DUF6173 family protein [unclassified Brevundimonas]|uniref:DUF6173 family protein n=1 Tax=unclassified Brevundimonas TaxID=2622653 RepID=UPI0025C0CFD8|nr:MULTISPECIES: DUF6173 family protein [unclassified Brevundimonas]